MITVDKINSLTRRLIGRAVTSSDGAEYDEARTVWNGSIDRHPEIIVQCVNAADVAAAIEFARTNDMEISVRGGGHNLAGLAVGDGGLTIDLRRISNVSVDPTAAIARCGGGATWGQLDGATTAFELATPGGTVSHTGVAGLTLGGGYGWLTPMFGLACDNLVSAQVVTADGKTMCASSEENQDLFWALRGGGGNFGVVTEFAFRLHRIPPKIRTQFMCFTQEDGEKALTVANQVLLNLPRNFGAVLAVGSILPAPFVPEEYHLQSGYTLILAGFGVDLEHAGLVDQIKAAVQPACDAMIYFSYAEMQRLQDEVLKWGVLAYGKSLNLDQLSSKSIAVLVDKNLERHSVDSVNLILPMCNAYSAVSDDETAFSGSRRNGMLVSTTALASDMSDLQEDRRWVGECWRDLRAHSTRSDTYLNLMTECDRDGVRDNFATAKYQRLARVKAKFDPENIFHRNANIVPLNPQGLDSGVKDAVTAGERPERGVW